MGDVPLLCVDDNPDVAAALEQYFSRLGGIRVVGWSSTADTLLQQVLELRPQVVLLDLSMPGKPAIQALIEVKAACPQVKVLILSAQLQQGALEAARLAGASGYILKEEDPSFIAAAIIRAAGGAEVFSEAALALLSPQAPAPQQSP
jgi:two-component system response regulator DesR